MSTMMLPPDPTAAPGLPVPPGGGPGPPGPMDALNQGPIPGGGDGGGGMAALLAALGPGGPGGGPPGPGDGGPPGPGNGNLPTPGDVQAMDPVEHIQIAMQHLMMALAKDQDEQRGGGIVKGMGALQAILGGEAKKNAQLQQIGG